MGSYQIEVKPTAEKDLENHKKSSSQATKNKITQLFAELEEHPYEGTGRPEKLKGDLSGFWSRRINKKDRLIYSVDEGIVTVYVVSAMGHYADK